MTPTETATILRKFREWRRDDDYILPQPDPREVGKAIDAAVEMIDRLEAAESVLKDFGATVQEVECWLERYRCIEREAEALRTRLEAAESDALEQARLNGMGGEREAALMAKLEAAEKERDDVAWQLAQSEQGKRKISEECDALRAAVRHEADCVDAAKAEIEALRSELVDLRSSMAFRTSLVGRIAAERDALRAKIEAIEQQEPVAWLHETRPDSGVVTDTVKRVWEASVAGSLAAYSIPLCLAPGAQPAPSLPDTHNDMVVGLDYQGAMSCAQQRAKKEAGLLYPEGDARKDEKERELASEYYRQYTTPNTGAKP